MNAQTPASSLIVVALDVTEREDYAIELARRLVPADTPELLGLFVESAELLEHANSRLAREVLLTGAVRAFDRVALERQLRAEAVRARARFEAASARLGLRHRFEVARGDVFGEPIKRASAAGALILNVARALRGGGLAQDFLQKIAAAELPLVLLARAGRRIGDGIVTLINDIDEADTLLGTAARLSSGRVPIAVLVRAPDAADREQVEARAADALRDRGVAGDRVIAVADSTAGIVFAASACRPRLLVMALPTAAPQSELIEAVLRRIPSELLLVRRGA